ncbi:PBECR4 domain-containing protein, partial [Treponema sp.]|uniref:PBECR4 domain-containing protein n=1 Tax=Treponema sp. TaxID=166 RepID=UPI0038903E2B
DNQREIVFDWILSESIKTERIESSQFYSKIKDRVHYLAQLESIFDSNDTIFKYDEKENILTSQITGEYLMKNIVESRNIFTFLDKTKDGKYYCKSFFPQTFKDYSYRQKKWLRNSSKKDRSTASTATKTASRQ